MDWSVALPNIWFLLITILFTGFFVLEGYDFGVGVLAQVLGKTDEDKRVYFNTIGPFWWILYRICINACCINLTRRII